MKHRIFSMILISAFTAVMFSCTNSTEKSSDKYDINIVIKNSETYEYKTGIAGDEEGVIITKQSKHHEISEIIRGKETSDETYQVVDQMAKDLGKIPGVSNDFPGFVANRILMPYINEGAWALHEGVSDPENIDLIAKTCLNMPMGPLELGDLIGLDVCLAIMNVMYEGFKDEKFAPCPKLVELVEKGDLGRKSGKGFYDYSK